MPVPREDPVTFCPDDLVEELRRAIAGAGDPERAPQMQAYMKSSMPFRGVNAQPLAQLCRVVMDAHRVPDRETWHRVVLMLWDGAEYREERYAALALTGHRYYRGYQDPSLLPLYRHLVVTGAWWDYVDQVAAHRVGPILRGAPGTVTPLMLQWARDDHLWVRRTALLCQLSAKAATDTDLLGFVLERNLEDSPYGMEFFIRKAVGWALREYAKTDEDWVVDFVERHHDRLSGLSRREALKNVRR
jgi:3-methyladenine DNA glycosylase AlkD